MEHDALCFRVLCLGAAKEPEMTCEEFREFGFENPDPLQCSRGERAAMEKHLRECEDCAIFAEVHFCGEIPEDLAPLYRAVRRADLADQEYLA